MPAPVIITDDTDDKDGYICVLQISGNTLEMPPEIVSKRAESENLTWLELPWTFCNVKCRDPIN